MKTTVKACLPVFIDGMIFDSCVSCWTRSFLKASASHCELLVGGVVGIVEDRLLVLVEEIAAAAIDLRDEGVEEVRQLLVVLVDDRMLHAARP